jgi:hypothetical protein
MNRFLLLLLLIIIIYFSNRNEYFATKQIPTCPVGQSFNGDICTCSYVEDKSKTYEVNSALKDGVCKKIMKGYYTEDGLNMKCNGKEVNGVCKPIDPNAIQCEGNGYGSSCQDSLGANYGPCSRGLCFCNENKNMGIKNGKCQLCDNKKGEGISIQNGTCIKCPPNYKIHPGNKTCVPK